MIKTEVEKSFIANFEAEVLVQYQQMGSKLRNTVRTKNRISGNATTFDPVGEDSPRPVGCTLENCYAGDWVGRIDDLKANIRELQVVAKASAYSLGRKSDDQIINTLGTYTPTVGSGGYGLTKNTVLAGFGALELAGAPDDGQRFAVVGWRQWSDLLSIDEFANADYVSEDQLPWKGTQAKRWLGTLWIPHSGLPRIGQVRWCFWYHKTAIGHAIGGDVKTTIHWHQDHDAYFINNLMAQGACLIDPSRVVGMRCSEKDHAEV